MTINGVDDANDFQVIKDSMATLKFGDMQKEIFRVLAAVLHLGNVVVEAKDEGSVIKNPESR